MHKVAVRVRKAITLEYQIETFMLTNENSIKLPDKKEEHLIYRLTYLNVQRGKFLAEYKVDCSYSNFCKLVPSNIIKPKLQDCGTCLCMSCLNPQLNMEALCNLDLSLYADTEEVIKYTETELHEWSEKIRQIKWPICYLYWRKEKKGSDENHVARTYLNTKKTKTVTSTVFADDAIKDIKELFDHPKRMISQFRIIKEIKEIIAENNNSLCIRVDWS